MTRLFIRELRAKTIPKKKPDICARKRQPGSENGIMKLSGGFFVFVFYRALNVDCDGSSSLSLHPANNLKGSVRQNLKY